MDPIRELFRLAAGDGHIDRSQVDKLTALVAKRQGDLDMAGGLLTRFHDVPAQAVAQLVDEVRGRAAPEPEVYTEFELVEDDPAEFEVLPQVDEEEFEVLPQVTGRVISKKKKKPLPPAQPDDPNAPAVLVVYPLDGDPSKDQIREYAAAFKVIPYEARLRLNGVLPRLTETGSAEALLPLVDRLRPLGIPCSCVERDGLFPPQLRTRVVKRIDRRGNRLEMTVVDHYAGDESVLCDAPVELDLSGPRLLLTGRYDFSAKASVTVLTSGGRAKKVTGRANDFLPFAHLYFPHSQAPFEISERDLVNFEFLGGEKGLSARVNLETTYAMLTQGPDGQRDDRLYTYAGRIQESVSGMGTAQVSVGTRSVGASSTEMSTVQQTEALSRALFFRWLEGLD